jgi:cysteinyl-tRNA synthetase
MDSVLSVLGRNAPVAGAVRGEDPSFVDAVEGLIARRAAARASKDWAESDRIRDELAALGVTIKDGPSGASWSRS